MKYKEQGIQIFCSAIDLENPDYTDEAFDWICVAKDMHGEVIAFAKFSEIGDFLVPYNVEVSRNFRRLGIATAMYDLASSTTNKEISPDEDQTPDAIEFWKSRE